MFAYRNIAYTSNPFDSDNYDILNVLKELEADEFTVLDCIPSSSWICEQELIKRCRSNSPFFNYISDKKICEILLFLSKDDRVLRNFVETDLDEENKIEIKSIEPQAACISLRTDG